MANEKVREVRPMRGHRGPGGPKPKVENPGMIMKRLVGYVFAKYKFHFVAVIVCILLSSLMTLRGTWFMQSLIDDYIIPLTKAQNPDFAASLAEITIDTTTIIMVIIVNGISKTTIITKVESTVIKEFKI